MRCQTVRQKLEAFAAAGVAPQVRERINGHLRSCSGCREALARQKELEALIRSVPAPPVPDGFAGRLMVRARVRGQTPRPVSRSGWKPLGLLGPQQLRLGAGTAAALAAGLLIGGFMGRQTWQRSAVQIGARNQVVEADPVGASGLSFLTGLGDKSLGEAYLGLTWAPDDEGI